MSELQRAVNLSVASSGIRLINYLIDLIGVILVIFIIAFILGIFDALSVFDIFEEGITGNLLSYGIYALYYFLFEWGTKGRSLGKWITATKVIKENGDENLTTKDYFLRSLARIIPFEPFSFLFFRNGWHDSISGTRVVNIKEFRENKFKFDAINQIGAGESTQNI